MAGPFYVDPAAGGANDGSSWVDAWTSIQSAFDTVVAGEICYCRGTQTFADATTLDLDTNSGTNTAGFIKFIGCNASGNVDGTRFVIDVNSKDCHGITDAAQDMVWFENIEIKNAGGSNKDGYYMAASSHYQLVFVNCSFHNNSQNGMTGSNEYYTFTYRCCFYLNGQHGKSADNNSCITMFCSFHDNTATGRYSSNSTAIGCLMYDNGDDNVYIPPACSGLLYNCVIDGATDDGIYMPSTTPLYGPIIFGCRITNQSGAGDIGISFAAVDPAIMGYNFFDNNADHINNLTIVQMLSLPNGTTDSNTYVNEGGAGGGDINQGYTDDDPEDYNLRSDATLRRTAISIPLT